MAERDNWRFPQIHATISGVPQISEFYGIVIAMYYSEHGVPHFHAMYSGQAASIAIEAGEVIAGALPDRALRLIREWTTLHQAELALNWQRARDQQPLDPIPPLA